MEWILLSAALGALAKEIYLVTDHTPAEPDKASGTHRSSVNGVDLPGVPSAHGADGALARRECSEITETMDDTTIKAAKTIHR